MRYCLLGPMEISIDGTPTKLPGTAERALLALLLLAPGRTLSATLLIDRLWSQSMLPVDPMNALQLRVSKLRKTLKAIGLDGVVVRDGVGYRAAVAPRDVDASEAVVRLRLARTEAAAAASADGWDDRHVRAYDELLAMWRGEALSDFAGEHWAMVEASRLSELRLGACTEWAQMSLALGGHLQVVGDLEPLVAADPTLETLAGLLMLALYRAGRQADALDVFARTRGTLDDSLGLEPSMSLRSLQERVLRQDPGLDLTPDMPVAPSITVPAGISRRTEDRPAPTNLPTVVRPLIGRDAQLEKLVEMLNEKRLVSLIGPGGAGKTSLALAAVVRSSSSYPDGTFGVRLASIDTGDQVPLAVADAIGVPLDGAAGQSVHARLIAYLARRQMLLLVDNCEHVIDGAASLIDEILGRCPGLTVIATSRVALAVPDEVQVIVGPLLTTPESALWTEVLEFPASQLFAERAHAVRPERVLDADEVLAIGRIGRGLDGMPLALELAAARVASMSPVEISQRLDDRFGLLTSGARTAEARQQTLRATVDWSYALLSELEQRIFNRLSVFQGGWTLEAAAPVVGDEEMTVGQVLHTVGRLVEQSMIVAESGHRTRYRMLETLRQYAAEQLAAAGEAREISRRHAEHFSQVANEAENALRGHGQREALHLLAEEQPNIRAAISWLAGVGDDLDAALTLAGSLGMFWHLGRHLEGREMLGRLVSSGAGSPRARARALQALSLVERPRACLVHPSPRCAEAAAASLDLFEQVGDPWHAALSKVLLAVEGVTGLHLERSERLLREADEFFQKEGDAWGVAVIGFVRMETAIKAGLVDVTIRTGSATAMAFRQLDDPWGLSATLYHLGWGLRQFGQLEEGARVLEQAIDVAEAAGLWNTVQWAYADLAIAKVHIGDLEVAKGLFDRAVSASQDVGDGAGEVLAAYGYGLLAQVRNRWSEARSHYEAAVPGFERLGTPVMMGVALAGLARCDEFDGDFVAAGRRYDEVLAIGRRLREPGLTASANEGLARRSMSLGLREECAQLLAEASELRAKSSRPAPPHEARDLEVGRGLRTTVVQ